MALFHFHVGQIGRAKGFSAVAAAAYRSGEELECDYYGESHDYTKKGGVLYTEIFLPDYAPDRLRNRSVLWNEVEKIEKHPKAQLCYSFDIALQNELSFDDNLELARSFVQEEMVEKGMICDMAIHEPDKSGGGIPNPHFHIICPIRPYDEEEDEWGEKQHREYVLDDNGERIRDENGKYIFNAVPTTDWGRPETLELWREHWADRVNAKFEEKGLLCRIDHRSYVDQGLDQIPQVHEGSAVRRMEERGIVTEKGDHNRFVKATNRMIKDIVHKLKEFAEWFKNLKNESDELKGKPLTGMIIEYFGYRDKVAETYQHGSKRAQMTNFKVMTQVISYLHGNDLYTTAQLEDKINSLMHSAQFAQIRIDQLKVSIRYNRDNVKYCKALIETREVYEKSQKIFFPGAKKKFQNEHQKELKRYHVAERYFSKRNITGDPESLLDFWKKSIAEDSDKLDKEYARLKPINAELKQLKEIQNAIEYTLAKRNGENPNMPSLRMHDRDTENTLPVSNRKSFKAEYKKAKTEQVNHEKQRIRTIPERNTKKHRHRD